MTEAVDVDKVTLENGAILDLRGLGVVICPCRICGKLPVLFRISMTGNGPSASYECQDDDCLAKREVIKAAKGWNERNV